MRPDPPSSPSPHQRQWCDCPDPSSGLLDPFRCSHCGRELHLETLVRVPVHPVSLALRRMKLALQQPVSELIERP